MSSSDLRNGEVGLFPELPTAGNEERTTGILPSQAIRELIARGRIIGNRAITEEQIQPASLDLRLGDIAHRVQASFLPGPGGKVEAKVKDLRMARVDLTSAAVFEKGCVYIVPLLEELDLPRDISGKANPKSTTGRLDCCPYFYGGGAGGDAAQSATLRTRQSSLFRQPDSPLG